MNFYPYCSSHKTTSSSVGSEGSS